MIARPTPPPTDRRSRLPLMASASVLMLGAALTLALWLFLEHTEQQVAERQVGLVAEQSARRLEDYIAGRLLALELVVDHVEDMPGVPAEEPFIRVAQRVHAHFSGFQAINWIDRDGSLMWLMPLAGNEPAQGRVIYDHEGAGAFALHAASSGRPTATPPIDLFQGGRGLAAYLPVHDAAGLRGMVNGVFRVRALVEDCFSDPLLADYALELGDGGAHVFVSPGFAALADRATGQAHLQVLDRSWTLRLAPRDAVWKTLRLSNTLVLPLGLGSTGALALLLFVWGRDQEQRRAARLERASLEAELQRARRLETIGRLAGGIAHDFNNLLTVVSAHAELARSHGDARAQAHLDAIDAASDRAAALTRQLLAYGGHGPRPEGMVDLDRHLDDLVGLLRRLVRDDVCLILSAGAEGTLARVHPEHLGQIVLNLVVNAADAMPEGGQVDIWTRAHPDTEQVEIGVRDHGTGIDETIRDRLFDPFFTTKGDRGTGMGLATVAALVQDAGGRVELSSVPGGGATFRVWLPSASATAQGPTPTTSPLRRHERADAEGYRVLVVDDDALVRNAVQKGLERAGFEVIAARDGREALGLALGDGPKPDVVVSDQVMPEMGGLALARALAEEVPELPVVLISGYADGSPEERRALVEQGIHFVEKPFQIDALAKLCLRLARQG